MSAKETRQSDYLALINKTRRKSENDHLYIFNSRTLLSLLHGPGFLTSPRRVACSNVINCSCTSKADSRPKALNFSEVRPTLLFAFTAPYADSHFHSFATTLPRDSQLFSMGLAALPQWKIPVAQFFIPLDIGNQIYQELPKESMGLFFQGFFLESVGL